MAVIHQLKPAKAPALSRRGQRFTRALRRQAGTAIGIGAVAVTLTALSLSHLAHGITIVTGADGWETWAMAIGIDLGFVALELSQLAATSDKVRKQISRFTKPAIIGTLTGSAGMNAFAFAAQAVGVCMTAAAITLGVAIPGVDLRSDARWRRALHRLPLTRLARPAAEKTLSATNRGATFGSPLCARERVLSREVQILFRSTYIGL